MSHIIKYSKKFPPKFLVQSLTTFINVYIYIYTNYWLDECKNYIHIYKRARPRRIKNLLSFAPFTWLEYKLVYTRMCVLYKLVFSKSRSDSSYYIFLYVYIYNQKKNITIPYMKFVIYFI